MSANDELQAHTCEKILQECGDVANNVAHSKVQDLTEQWKKGELPYGYYYIKTVSGGEVIDRYYRDCTDYDLCEYGDVWENRFEDEIIEVLAPVPSYEEWQKVLNIDFNNEVLRLENAKLKELLKEAKDIIEWYKADCGYKDTPTEAILTKIDNAIGEKK